jgi:hypothetical protein
VPWLIVGPEADVIAGYITVAVTVANIAAPVRAMNIFLFVNLVVIALILIQIKKILNLNIL